MREIVSMSMARRCEVQGIKLRCDKCGKRVFDPKDESVRHRIKNMLPMICSDCEKKAKEKSDEAHG